MTHRTSVDSTRPAAKTCGRPEGPPVVLVHGRSLSLAPEGAAVGRLVRLPGPEHLLPLTHDDLVAGEVARWARVPGVPPGAAPAVGERIGSAGTLPVRGR